MDDQAGHPDNILYTERVSSPRTEALFVALSLLFLALLLWRVNSGRRGALAIIFRAFFLLFFFYSLNYRVLLVQLTTQALTLKFGMFSWRIPLEDIQAASLDEIPVVKRLGGAGIHFMTVRQRYRASFNFLEYPRIVISLKRKSGPVRDISFSTRRPEELLRLIQAPVALGMTA